MVMTPEELTAIEARANAATPGPWEVDVVGVEICRVRECVSRVVFRPGFEPGLSVASPADDSSFIAHARVDLDVLLAEVRRLQDQLTIRDMQLATHKELLAQSETKCDELRARWDRAETEREELQKLLEQTRGIASQRVVTANTAPRYSTKAVDALIDALTTHQLGDDAVHAYHAVRDSREPQR